MSNNGSRKISVRLTETAYEHLINAKKNGFTTSQFINHAITKCKDGGDVNALRTAMSCICNIQTEMEHEMEPEIKSSVRKELDTLCHVLKSSLTLI